MAKSNSTTEIFTQRTEWLILIELVDCHRLLHQILKPEIGQYIDAELGVETKNYRNEIQGPRILTSRNLSAGSFCIHGFLEIRAAHRM